MFFLGFGNFVSQRPADEVPSDTNQEEVMEDESSADTNEDDLVGTWRSKDDSNAVLDIHADGTYDDVYQGEVISGGTWSVMDSLAGEGLDIDPDFENDLYLKLIASGSGEIYLYNIAAATDSELVVTYLFGDVLRFERVN